MNNESYEFITLVNWMDQEDVAIRRRSMSEKDPAVVIKASSMLEEMRSYVARLQVPMQLNINAKIDGVELKLTVGRREMTWIVQHGDETTSGFHSLHFLIEHRTAFLDANHWNTSVSEPDTAFGQVVEYLTSIYDTALNIKVDMSSPFFGTTARISSRHELDNCECFCTGEPNPERLRRILQSAQNAESIVLEGMNFPHFDLEQPIQAESFDIDDQAPWFNRHALQQVKSKFIFLAGTSLTNEDIQEYIEDWITGEHREFCLLTIFHRRSLDFTEITKDIRPLEAQRADDCMPKLYQQWLPMNHTHRYDFESDDMQLLLSVVASDMELMLFVWDPDFIEIDEEEEEDGVANEEQEELSEDYEDHQMDEPPTENCSVQAHHGGNEDFEIVSDEQDVTDSSSEQ